ncbi:hypothetical protein [Alienimonas californiensis]|uniref:Uncharacterized protein n=1 Tax=Alienimonas californiensis TaxID=2527989 RepID=A0A517P6R0_9PLAN|nr:hypothetical protein [Alienimonas californiensis]QDT15055.1 hypothetical protein CA12_11350 [Alienimonas californiensis]
MTVAVVSPGRILDPSISAPELAAQLGPALAGWWMPAASRAEAAAALCDDAFLRVPRRPDEPGACAVLCWRRGGGAALREGLPIPVRWEGVDNPGEPVHDPRLPKDLRSVADDVRREFPDEGRGRQLALDDPPAENGPPLPDLSGFSPDVLTAGSGFASLSAGLIAAATAPDERVQGEHPRVWATGAWRPGGGVDEVVGMPAKVAAAREIAAEWGDDQIQFFAPDGQLQQVKDAAASPGPAVTPRTFAADPRPAVALAPLLAACRLPPDPRADLDVLLEYEEALRPHDAPSADAFYRAAILPHVVVDVSPSGESPGPITHLVTVVSGQTEPAELAARALRPPPAVLLLHTHEFRSKTARLQGRLRQGGVLSVDACEFIHPGDQADAGAAWMPALGDALRASVARFLEGADASRVLFELTGGTSAMKLALALGGAIPAGAVCRVLDSGRYHPVLNRAMPGTQRDAVWRAGESWGAEP